MLYQLHKKLQTKVVSFIVVVLCLFFHSHLHLTISNKFDYFNQTQSLSLNCL